MGDTERECVEEFPPRPRKNNFPTFVREGGDAESWTYGERERFVYKTCLREIVIGPISSQKASLRSEGNELFATKHSRQNCNKIKFGKQNNI